MSCSILFGQACFGNLGLSFLHMNFMFFKFCFCEEWHWNFDWDCIESDNFHNDKRLFSLAQQLQEYPRIASGKCSPLVSPFIVCGLQTKAIIYNLMENIYEYEYEYEYEY